MVYKKGSQKLVSKAELARRTGVTPSGINKASKNQLKFALVGKSIDLDHESCIAFMKKHTLSQQKQPVTGVDERYEEAFKYCTETNKCSIRHIENGLNIPRRRAEKISKLIKATGLIPSKKPTEKTKKIKEQVINGHIAKNQKKRTESLEKFQDEIENGEKLHTVPQDIEKFADMTLREIYTRFGTEYAFNEFLKAMKSIEDINGKRIKNATEKGKLVSKALINQGIIEPFDSIHVRFLTDVAKKLSIRIPAKYDAGSDQAELQKYIVKEFTSVIKPVKDKVNRIKKELDEKEVT